MICPNCMIDCKEREAGHWCETCTFTAPKNKYKCESIYVFVNEDANGMEGILSAEIGNMNMPLVTANKDLIPTMRKIAKQLSERSGVKVKMLKFRSRKVVEVL